MDFFLDLFGIALPNAENVIQKKAKEKKKIIHSATPITKGCN